MGIIGKDRYQGRTEHSPYKLIVKHLGHLRGNVKRADRAASRLTLTAETRGDNRVFFFQPQTARAIAAGATLSLTRRDRMSATGGDDDDLLVAGSGVGDVLIGGTGNDRIFGSDEGADTDPDFSDLVYFGSCNLLGTWRGQPTVKPRR